MISIHPGHPESNGAIDILCQILYCNKWAGDNTHEKNGRPKHNTDARGMIPIEKNIIVSDANGRRIGSTYPKRAKGLVKNGRAEYVSDHEIHLNTTHAPAVIHHTEDIGMSKIIDFHTRDFEFEKTCNSNVGFRGFITTPVGDEEIWEIGSWGWDWTQITSKAYQLEPNTDYIFRFAMTLGHNDDNREESLVHIVYCDDGKDGWEDRFTYCIRMSRFKPIISKRVTDEQTMLRVFELPFHTGDHSEWRIMIVSNHAVARFFRAKEIASYANLEDLSYEDWRKERTAFLDAERASRNARQAAANRALLPQSPANEKLSESDIREMIEAAMENSSDTIAELLDERIDEAINDSISEFFSEGMEDFWATHPLVLNDGRIVSAKQRTKVMSPDKKKVLSCYGELRVEDTSKWDGRYFPRGWALSVQTRISSWDVLYVYETEKEAMDALVLVNDAINKGMSLIEL